jgi:hypothetical protein
MYGVTACNVKKGAWGVSPLFVETQLQKTGFPTSTAGKHYIF